MVAALGIGDARAPGREQRRLDRRLDGLGAAVGQEARLEALAGEGDEPRGQLAGERIQALDEEAGRVPGEVIGERGLDRRRVVAEVEAAEAGDPVVPRHTVGVFEHGAVAAHEADVASRQLEEAPEAGVGVTRVGGVTVHQTPPSITTVSPLM